MQTNLNHTNMAPATILHPISLLTAMAMLALAHGVYAQQPAAAAKPAGAADILIQDFEGADYGTWKTEGTAFGTAPAKGTLDGQMEVTGFQGKGFASSFVGGDGSTGKLTSPEFTIERDHVKFLIGGGGIPAKTCVNLLIDGKIALSATGPNTCLLYTSPSPRD